MDSTWAELLRSYLRLRGISQSALARELGISTGIMSQWMHGAMPELRSALKVAALTGISERQVLEAAHLQIPAAGEDSRYPGFLTEKLDQLTPAEMAVLAETASGLLRFREEKSAYEAAPARRGRPRKAPPVSPPE